MLKYIYKIKKDNDNNELVLNAQQEAKIEELPLNNMNAKKNSYLNKKCFFVSLFLIALVLLILFNLTLIVLVYKRTVCDSTSNLVIF
jgi:lipopolysaccharide/colanic/teichoic acid biosynthesis glycosyltransferase